MTAAQLESLSLEGVHSLEVRWILPGALTAAAVGWFGRFAAETRVVEDTYLLDPHLPGLSVKVRGGRALEVKAYRGSPGQLELAGCAHGRLESWQKWSFPHGPPGHGSADPVSWRPVRKRRRISWFSQATEVGVPGLGGEASGPSGALRSELDAAAAQVFAQALPGGLELGLRDSMSYAQWLRRRP